MAFCFSPVVTALFVPRSIIVSNFMFSLSILNSRDVLCKNVCQPTSWILLGGGSAEYGPERVSKTEQNPGPVDPGREPAQLSPHSVSALSKPFSTGRPADLTHAILVSGGVNSLSLHKFSISMKSPLSLSRCEATPRLAPSQEKKKNGN